MLVSCGFKSKTITLWIKHCYFIILSLFSTLNISMFVHSQPLTLNLIRGDDALIFHVVGGLTGGGESSFTKSQRKKSESKSTEVKRAKRRVKTEILFSN